MGVKTSQKIIMKLIVALSAVLALASGDQCEDCTAVVTTLATYLTTEESISRQTDILLAEVCPGAEDADSCVANLPDFWSRVAMVLWPGYYDPMGEWMCATEDICGAPGLKAKLAMTCDECLGGIQASVEQMLSEEFMMGIVEALSGEGFCGMEEDPELCAQVIAQLIPAALPALAAGFDPAAGNDSVTWLSLTLVWLKLLYKKYTRIS